MIKFLVLFTIISCTTKYVVEASCYNPVEEQTSEHFNITASGKLINVEDPLTHRYIAVSRDLEALGFTMGSKVIVSNAHPYNGEWTVEDRMNSRWTLKIDFLVGTEDYIHKWDSVVIKLKD